MMMDVMQRKSSVTSTVCAARHYSRENPAWLTYAAALILHCILSVDRHRRCDLDLLTRNKKEMGFWDSLWNVYMSIW